MYPPAARIDGPVEHRSVSAVGYRRPAALYPECLGCGTAVEERAAQAGRQFGPERAGRPSTKIEAAV